jgi:2-oxoglutarate ferredoxin oxidoreductase subunit gamma
MERLIQILLGGTGGQGLGLAGAILAQAVAEEEGKNVIETELYGISMRGGMSLAQVMVSSGEVTEIRVTEPDILLAMSQFVADLYIPKTKKNGVILLDATHVGNIPASEANVFRMPFTEAARSLGNETVANVVALGSISSLTNVVKKQSLVNTLRKRFSSSALEINLKALEVGYAMKPR